MTKLETYISDIIKLCETHKVKTLYAFGSVLTDRFNQESDIDMIVDFMNMEVEDYADNYLTSSFHCKIYLTGQWICWRRRL